MRTIVYDKVKVATIVGAAVTVFLWLNDVLGLGIRIRQDELTALIVTVVMALAAYFKTERTGTPKGPVSRV